MAARRIVIIGGGFAGMASAYFLARDHVGEVVILEQEPLLGVHASGNNAAMARQFVPDPDVQRLAVRGTAFLYRPPGDVAKRPLIRVIGSLLLFDATAEHAVRRAVADAQTRGVGATVIRRAECEARVPVLVGADFAGAVWTPTDGVIDIAAYLEGLRRGAVAAGARGVTDARVTANAPGAGGARVTTTAGVWQADIVVNAAGAWADRIAALADAAPRGLVPLRRHLFQSEQRPEVSRHWPFVWDQTHEYYFRPESGGLLLCACDEVAQVPGPPGHDPGIAELLAHKLAAHCPRLADARIAKSWAGLRTFAPDRRPAIGWDIRCPWFYWVAGLGGHGVTCAAAVGEYVAKEIHQR
ncbi:MAG: FAD-binding oxidoreductase [Deltaproteobacteria bacterium]|nr:FAD-binding oxidoreductase [Deltaproteobacteria bacterium]